MIFNKVNRHELSVRFPWSAVTCSSAGSHGSSQLRFRFMCSSSVFAYLSSSRCWVFLCFSTCGSHQAVTLGAATVCSRFPPPPPSLFFFFLPLIIISVDGCLEWGLMAGLRGFASHGSGILRGWLATVEAPGITHLLLTKRGPILHESNIVDLKNVIQIKESHFCCLKTNEKSSYLRTSKI